MPMETTSGDVIDILERLQPENPTPQTFVKQISQPPRRFHLTTLLVMLWCVSLLTISAMVVLPLPDPIRLAQHLSPQTLWYGFQIPTAIYIVAVLGRRFGTMTLAMYLLGGLLGLPLFANGGGWQYFSELTIGYLVGFLAIPWAMHPLLIKAFHGTGWLKGRSLWLVLAACLGVCAVHTVGLVGVGMQMLMGMISPEQFFPWLQRLTWPVMLYDVGFAIIAVAVARFTRALLWFCLY